jgi:hypothetical protein
MAAEQAEDRADSHFKRELAEPGGHRRPSSSSGGKHGGHRRDTDRVVA